MVKKTDKRNLRFEEDNPVLPRRSQRSRAMDDNKYQERENGTSIGGLSTTVLEHSLGHVANYNDTHGMNLLALEDYAPTPGINYSSVNSRQGMEKNSYDQEAEGFPYCYMPTNLQYNQHFFAYGPENQDPVWPTSSRVDRETQELQDMIDYFIIPEPTIYEYKPFSLNQILKREPWDPTNPKETRGPFMFANEFTHNTISQIPRLSNRARVFGLLLQKSEYMRETGSLIARRAREYTQFKQCVFDLLLRHWSTSHQEKYKDEFILSKCTLDSGKMMTTYVEKWYNFLKETKEGVGKSDIILKLIGHKIPKEVSLIHMMSSYGRENKSSKEDLIKAVNRYFELDFVKTRIRNFEDPVTSLPSSPEEVDHVATRSKEKKNSKNRDGSATKEKSKGTRPNSSTRSNTSRRPKANTKLPTDVKMSTETNRDSLIEQKFRDELFSGDLTKVFFTRLSCTVCDETLNSSVLEGKLYEHPILKVLLCETHHQMNTAQININSGISRCTWCGLLSETNGGIVCIQCDRIFCQKCITLNFGPRAYEEAKLRCDISVWQCFLCVQKENFLFLRAICSAAKNCLEEEPTTTEPSEDNPNDEIDSLCVICLRNETSIGPELRLRTDYRLIELVCLHKFHRQCFNDWIKVNKSCPICRSTDIHRFIRIEI